MELELELYPDINIELEPHLGDKLETEIELELA